MEKSELATECGNSSNSTEGDNVVNEILAIFQKSKLSVQRAQAILHNLGYAILSNSEIKKLN